MLIERIFIQARVRTCTVCLHPEDPTHPVRCISESCPCHGPAGGGLCSYSSEVDSAAYARVAWHLKRQGPCALRSLHTGVLLTPDSGRVVREAPKRDKPAKRVGGKTAPKEKRPAPRQLYDGPDGLLDRLEAKVRAGRTG
jgi:hypothetical protein